MTNGRIVCFGELLLRLTAPGRELMLQTPRLDVVVGGAEANVGIGLANLGHSVSMVSAVPDNALGRAAVQFVRSQGADTSGVQYREVEKGSGAKPTQNSDVQLQYKGSLVDGRTFVDTNTPQQGQPAGPVTMKVSQIPLTGLREALVMMPAGARWEVVLPADKAYGNTPQSPIGPNQAVVFDVKLVSVK